MGEEDGIKWLINKDVAVRVRRDNNAFEEGSNAISRRKLARAAGMENGGNPLMAGV